MDVLVKLREHQDGNMQEELHVYQTSKKEFFENTKLKAELTNEEEKVIKSRDLGKVIKILLYFGESYQAIDVLKTLKQRNPNSYQKISMKVEEKFNYILDF